MACGSTQHFVFCVYNSISIEFVMFVVPGGSVQVQNQSINQSITLIISLFWQSNKLLDHSSFLLAFFFERSRNKITIFSEEVESEVEKVASLMRPLPQYYRLQTAIFTQKHIKGRSRLGYTRYFGIRKLEIRPAHASSSQLSCWCYSSLHS